MNTLLKNLMGLCTQIIEEDENLKKINGQKLLTDTEKEMISIKLAKSLIEDEKFIKKWTSEEHDCCKNLILENLKELEK